MLSARDKFKLFVPSSWMEFKHSVLQEFEGFYLKLSLDRTPWQSVWFSFDHWCHHWSTPLPSWSHLPLACLTSASCCPIWVSVVFVYFYKLSRYQENLLYSSLIWMEVVAKRPTRNTCFVLYATANCLCDGTTDTSLERFGTICHDIIWSYIIDMLCDSNWLLVIWTPLWLNFHKEHLCMWDLDRIHLQHHSLLLGYTEPPFNCTRKQPRLACQLKLLLFHHGYLLAAGWLDKQLVIILRRLLVALKTYLDKQTCLGTTIFCLLYCVTVVGINRLDDIYSTFILFTQQRNITLHCMIMPPLLVCQLN